MLAHPTFVFAMAFHLSSLRPTAAQHRSTGTPVSLFFTYNYERMTPPRPTVSRLPPSILRRHRDSALLPILALGNDGPEGGLESKDIGDGEGGGNCDGEDEGEGIDTIRVRIWRSLASGREMSLMSLASEVGGVGGTGTALRRADLRHHLTHVERQARTLGNKSDAWRERRGLPPRAGGKKMSIRTRRRGPRNEVFVRLK